MRRFWGLAQTSHGSRPVSRNSEFQSSAANFYNVKRPPQGKALITTMDFYRVKKSKKYDSFFD